MLRTIGYRALVVVAMLSLVSLKSSPSFGQSTGVASDSSGNPVFPGWYADPEGVVFGDEYWIYPTTSARFPKQLYFDCFSSPDLVNWTKHERILDNARVKWARQAMWAPSVVEKDGKYYFFFGANDIQSDEEPGGIGVAVADNPAGPFKDYLGKPLIGKFHNGAQPIDQFVFKDGEQWYIVYGGWRHCNIAKLNDDFTGFIPFEDGTVFREITPDGYVEGPVMFRREGKLYFMWSEGNWTGPDYCVAYAMAESPLGPFQRIGKVLQQDPKVATGAGHHSVINVPGTEDWYCVYHRRPLGETDRDHRVTCIDRMEFNDDGTIKPVTITFEGVTSLRPALTVTELGKLEAGLSPHDEQHGTEKKWSAVRKLLGEDADRVIIKQLGGSLGGNTSVRNESPLIWKDKGYFRRARDLGQVFTAPHDFELDAIVLRTGNAHLAFLPGAAGAEVFVQFFEVDGEPVINDNGTPPGTDATHGFSKNHRCDDFVSGVTYKPLCVITGGRLPDLTNGSDGKLTYMKWSFSGGEPLRFEQGKRYAFMVGFVRGAPERNFTLANRNRAASPRPPAMNDNEDHYHGGWGLRREGSGKTPPRKIPGVDPPADPALLRQLKTESRFPDGDARYGIAPTCDGYPDVDTYRDLEFYMLEDRSPPPKRASDGTPIRILCIGDSITQGGRRDRNEYTYRYPLFQLLTDDGVDFDFIGTRNQGLHQDTTWPSYKGTPFDPDHEGYYGAKTATVRDRLEEALPNLSRPDIALIHLGTNDQSAEDYRADILAPLQDIVKILRERNPKISVLVGHLNFNGGAALKIRPIVEEITALSEKNSRVLTVHHYRGWNERPDHPDTDTFDWAHPNPQGQRKMALRWFEAMQPLITSR